VLFALILLNAAACNTEPAIVRAARKVELIHSLQETILKSVEAEKSAVLAATEAKVRESEEEVRRFAAEINRQRKALRQDVAVDDDPEETARLDAFDAAWRDFEDVDKRLLALVAANTNVKAARLSVKEGAAALDRFVEKTVEMQSTSNDAERVRNLLSASVAAFRIQSLLAAHIPSPDDAEMTSLEKRMKTFNEDIDQRLAAVDMTTAPDSPDQLKAAKQALSEYRKILAEVLKLSRQNTNVHAFDVSLHEKRRVTNDCLSALAALLKTVESAQGGTR
jgi:hypothetical protein